MEWLFGVIGFVLGAGLVWVWKCNAKSRSSILGVISPGTITCVSSTRVSVPFSAIASPSELEDGYIVRAKTFHGSTVPTWDDCASVGSNSPFECDITSPADDRIVMYGAFRRPGGGTDSPLPNCGGSSSSSSASSGGSGRTETQSVLP